MDAFNAYVELFNAAHADEIAAGELPALEPSSAEFVEKGLWDQIPLCDEQGRHTGPKQRMTPRLPERPNDAQSIQCEMGVAAAQQAMSQAGKSAEDIDSW